MIAAVLALLLPVLLCPCPSLALPPGKEQALARLQELQAGLRGGRDPRDVKRELLELRLAAGGPGAGDPEVRSLLEGITDSLNEAQRAIVARGPAEARDRLTVSPFLRRYAERLVPRHSFRRLATAEEIVANRAALRREIERLMGGFPQRAPLNPVVLEKRELEHCTREKVQFESEPGRSVVGYLLIPKGRKAPLPAVVCFHQHAREYFAGKDGPVGESGSDPDLAYALDLAERGYVTFTIDAPCFGERAEDEADAGYLAALVGRPLFGLVVYDDLRSIDYLETRSEVDKDRIGGFGHSLGGTRAIYAAALDDRIKASVSLNAFSNTRSLIAADIHRWPATAFLPGLLPYADLEDLVSMAAPRPQLLAVSELDGSLALGNAREEVAGIGRVYATLGAAGLFRFDVFAGAAHDFPAGRHEEVYGWLDRHLRR